MTIVTIGNKYITVSGHSNYAEYGKDIVCSAISFGSQFLINAYDLNYAQTEANLKFDISKLNKKVLQTYIDMIKGLEKQYKGFVEIRS